MGLPSGTACPFQGPAAPIGRGVFSAATDGFWPDFQTLVGPLVATLGEEEEEEEKEEANTEGQTP